MPVDPIGNPLAEAEMLSLAMNINQGPSHLFQNAQIYGASVNTTEATPGAANFTTQDQDIRIISLQTFVLQGDLNLARREIDDIVAYIETLKAPR